MARGRGGSPTAEWREPASSGRLPIRALEFNRAGGGACLAIGVSLQPAIPRRVAPQQSPFPLHQSPTILAQFPFELAHAARHVSEIGD